MKVIAKQPSKFGTQGIKIEGVEDWINVVVPDGDNLNNYPYIKIGNTLQFGDVKGKKIHLSQIRDLNEDTSFPPELPKTPKLPESPQEESKLDDYYDSLKRLIKMKPEKCEWTEWYPVIVSHINTWNFNK